MSLLLRPATADDVRVFAAWRYAPPYDAYDITGDVDDEVEYFLSEEVNCHVVVEDGAVVAYCTFGKDARVPGGDYDEDALDIGIGVDPMLTGQGRGRRYTTAVVDHALALFDHQRVRVTIAEANQRARRAAASVGFRETGRFTSPREVLGTRSFVVMENRRHPC